MKIITLDKNLIMKYRIFVPDRIAISISVSCTLEFGKLRVVSLIHVSVLVSVSILGHPKCIPLWNKFKMLWTTLHMPVVLLDEAKGCQVAIHQHSYCTFF